MHRGNFELAIASNPCVHKGNCKLAIALTRACTGAVLSLPTPRDVFPKTRTVCFGRCFRIIPSHVTSSSCLSTRQRVLRGLHKPAASQMPQLPDYDVMNPAPPSPPLCRRRADYLTKYQLLSLVGVSTWVAVAMAGCASGSRMPSRPLFAAGAATLESRSAKT